MQPHDKKLQFSILLNFVFALVAVVAVSVLYDKKDQVKSSEPFMMGGKEWECHYTPRQVEINILEEQLVKLNIQKQAEIKSIVNQLEKLKGE